MYNSCIATVTRVRAIFVRSRYQLNIDVDASKLFVVRAVPLLAEVVFSRQRFGRSLSLLSDHQISPRNYIVARRHST